MTSEEFSSEEEAVIEELRRRTVDCVTPKMLEDDCLFYRFAKARDFNLEEAESMLKKSCAWRKEMGIDTIQTDYEPPEVLVKYVPTSLMCFDKAGCAVRYTDAGQVDAKGLWNCAKKQDLMKYFAYRIEQDLEAVAKHNGKLEKQIFLPLFDFENMPYSTITNMKTIQYCLYFLKSYVDNFPERLKLAFAINAPFYFVWGFNIFKQVLPDTVLRKIRIYGKDGWKDELLKLIDDEVLPAFLGGKRTDPDGSPDCRTIVKRGEMIPKKYHMVRSENKLALANDVEKLSIMPFSKEEICFRVHEKGSCLEWEFEVKSKDIDFSLHFKDKNSCFTELVPKQRIDTHYETEKGLFKCEKTGSYTIVFDNSHSWIHPKEVYYRAAVKGPNDNKNDSSLDGSI